MRWRIRHVTIPRFRCWRPRHPLHTNDIVPSGISTQLGASRVAPGVGAAFVFFFFFFFFFFKLSVSSARCVNALDDDSEATLAPVAGEHGAESLSSDSVASAVRYAPSSALDTDIESRFLFICTVACPML